MNITYFAIGIFVFWFIGKVVPSFFNGDMDKAIDVLRNGLEEADDIANNRQKKKKNVSSGSKDLNPDKPDIKVDELDPKNFFFNPVKFKKAKDKYILTGPYRAQRARIMKRDGYRCDICGELEDLEMHHIRYSKLGWEGDEDLQILCKKHHQIRHDETGYDYRDTH